jgi:hypothetical protein
MSLVGSKSDDTNKTRGWSVRDQATVQSISPTRTSPSLPVDAYNPEVEQNKLHPSQLRVVSSNVLFDLHDKSKTYDFNDLIHCEARWPLLLKMLGIIF